MPNHHCGGNVDHRHAAAVVRVLAGTHGLAYYVHGLEHATLCLLVARASRGDVEVARGVVLVCTDLWAGLHCFLNCSGVRINLLSNLYSYESAVIADQLSISH